MGHKTLNSVNLSECQSLMSECYSVLDNGLHFLVSETVCTIKCGILSRMFADISVTICGLH